MIRPLFHGLFMMLLLSRFIAPTVSAENLETPHFLIIYPPSDAGLAETIAVSMEGARETLTDDVGINHEHRLTIKLVINLTNGGKARYLPDRRTIQVLTQEAMAESFGGRHPPTQFIEGVLWHEYVHFLQHQAMKRFIKDREALWFIEGTATYLGTLRFVRPYSPQAVWKEGESILSGGRLPTLEDLNHYHQTNHYPLTTYFFSSEAVAFLIDQWGMESLRQITRAMGEGEELRKCLSESLGIDANAFEVQWHDNLEKKYRRHIRNS